MTYPLVKEESRTIGKRKLLLYKFGRISCAVVGICAIGFGMFLLSGVENKLYERHLDASYSSTGTIVFSVLLIVAGLLLLLFAYYFHIRSDPRRRRFAGTTELWQKPFVEMKELPFEGPGTSGGDSQAVRSVTAEQNQGRLGEVEGVALCPRCRKIVHIRGGICQECGNPVV